ncbi:MAG TPA: transcription antitermination factor NusB [Alphaproteobacteria bacterium]|nr:transcription antitermination factor NusB [Alphaproteobacteria bacterium]
MPEKSERERTRRGGSGASKLSSARLAAVQAAYQMDMTGAGAETVLGEFLVQRPGVLLDEGGQVTEADRGLFAELVRGIARERAALDGMIASCLPRDWPLERIERVMAAALRGGAYELMHRPSVPARVVVSEYVDVAHAFLGDREVGMVNGVLDHLARVVREAEMEEEGGGRGSGPRPAR